MKKLLLLVSFVMFGLNSYSQEIGVRFGDVLGNDVALDMKFKTLHADVSFGNHVGVELLWDFIQKPLGSEEFTWYLGAGPSMLTSDPFKLGVSGEAGLQYSFAKVPISLSLDWRPTLFIIEDTDFDAGGFGFNARFVFGKKG